MKIGITGATGFIGSRLSARLISAGHEVAALRRGQEWDFAGMDAVIHLAGESIMGRWTASKKEKIRESRARGTRRVAEELARLDSPPKTLICASAVGYYGDRGEEELTESSPSGTNFLADVCRDWEDAASAARTKGLRVAHIRTGIVLHKDGGALAKMLLPFKLGVGGKIGSGRQFMSWIDMEDLLNVFVHALNNEGVAGPVNAVSPNPVTNEEFTKILGKVLSRPTVFPLPAFIARLAMGQMADELLLASARVIPKKLQETEFEFTYPRLEESLKHLLNDK